MKKALISLCTLIMFSISSISYAFYVENDSDTAFKKSFFNPMPKMIKIGNSFGIGKLYIDNNSITPLKVVYKTKYGEKELINYVITVKTTIENPYTLASLRRNGNFPDADHFKTLYVIEPLSESFYIPINLLTDIQELESIKCNTNKNWQLIESDKNAIMISKHLKKYLTALQSNTSDSTNNHTSLR